MTYSPGWTFNIFLFPVLFVGTQRCLKYVAYESKSGSNGTTPDFSIVLISEPKINQSLYEEKYNGLIPILSLARKKLSSELSYIPNANWPLSFSNMPFPCSIKPFKSTSVSPSVLKFIPIDSKSFLISF